MAGINFGTKATNYEESGLVQKLNADILLDLAVISGQADVLDLGCGPGGVTAKIAGLTGGKVVGIDLSEGMIEQAKAAYGDIANLDFQVKDATKLGFNNEFDSIFCNSAFQWFRNPDRVLNECYRALKPGGIMVIQSPATSQYCPVFITAIEEIANHPQTGFIFSHFRNPLFMLNSAEEYTELLKRAGFNVEYSQLRNESNCFSVKQVLGIFKSGAENAYLNQEYYDLVFDDAYIHTCRNIIAAAIQNMADHEDRVDLRFTRIYLRAGKGLD